VPLAGDFDRAIWDVNEQQQECNSTTAGNVNFAKSAIDFHKSNTNELESLHHRQVAYWVKTPPSTGPNSIPIWETPMRIPTYTRKINLLEKEQIVSRDHREQTGSFVDRY